MIGSSWFTRCWFLSVLAVGISVFLFFSPWFIPVLGLLFNMWTPAPLLILYRRHGKIGRLGIIGAILLSLFFTSTAIKTYFIYYSIMALILGEASIISLSDIKAIILAGVVAASIELVGILVVNLFFSANDFHVVFGGEWQQALNNLLANYYENIFLEQEQILLFQQLVYQVSQIVIKLIPGLLIVGSLLQAWGNQLLVNYVISEEDENKQKQYNFIFFKLPELLIWLVILVGIIVWLCDGLMYWIGLNILLVLCVAYFFQGLAVLVYWLKKSKIPKVLRLGIYILLVIENILTILIALVGLFDVWFNFRQIEETTSVYFWR